MNMHDETERTRTVVCRQRAYTVPVDVADELDARANSAVLHELRTLRVSVARSAQAAGVSLAAVHCADDAPHESLYLAASTRESGWNKLAAEVATAARGLLQLLERSQ